MKSWFSFEASARMLLVRLLAAAVLFIPLQSVQAEKIGGVVNAVDKAGRVITVEGNAYTLSLQPEIINVTGESPQKMGIGELRSGYYVEFENSKEGVVYSLRVFEHGPPQ